MNPFLSFLLEVQIGLKSGHSLSTILPQVLQGTSSFHRDLQVWWQIRQNRWGGNYTLQTHYRRLLQQILEHGLDGGRILAPLAELEAELHAVIEQNREHHLEKLPFRLMLPLLIFVFPSFLILLFGPLIQSIYMEVLQ